MNAGSLHRIITFTLIMIIGVVIGSVFRRDVDSAELQIQRRENERIRKEALIKLIEIGKLRRVLAQERENFYVEINKSIKRYDSLEALSLARQKKLQREINRLKNSTVKELEDEAERIYNTANHNQ